MTLLAPERKWRAPKNMDARRSQLSWFDPQATPMNWL
jgi:hypothetical protein